MSAVIIASDEGEYGINQAIDASRSGASLFDCLEQGIRAVEDDVRARTVGFGGAPNAAGLVELDACIMDGRTRQCGSVGALSDTKNPISVARKVLEVLPHVFLVGEGAKRFSREVRAEQSSMLADCSKADFEKWRESKHLASDSLSEAPLIPCMDFTPRRNLSLGTVTFMMRTEDGHFAGGVSTSGWAYKYPGRLGDSPVIGAGLYVDDRYGAASCTHTGEMTIRTSAAHQVVMHMRYGKSVREACELVAEDLSELQGGYLGPVILHALDRHGEPYVLRLGNTLGDRYWIWQGNDTAPRCERAIPWSRQS